jgi:glyoxylase-like metal-dependent hydrolase (beta-lactamase superfamily II)
VGHSADGISIFVEEDRVLFAGDAFMPVPYIVDGNIDDMTASMKKIGRMGLENIIQGHGDVILRGEIEVAVKENMAYLTNIRKVAKTAARRREPQEYMDGQTIEICGKSRVHLGGLGVELHRNNLLYLYQIARAEYLEDREEKKATKAESKPTKASKRK